VGQLYITRVAATANQVSNLEPVAMTYSEGTGCFGKAWIKRVYLVYSALDQFLVIQRTRQPETRTIPTAAMTCCLATPGGNFDKNGVFRLR
jgi:hypothetical protein